MKAVDKFANGYAAGKAMAEASLKVGEQFTGAWGIARALGFENESAEWAGASLGAMEIFGKHEIYLNAGKIVEIVLKPMHRKGA